MISKILCSQFSKLLNWTDFELELTFADHVCDLGPLEFATARASALKPSIGRVRLALER